VNQHTWRQALRGATGQVDSRQARLEGWCSTREADRSVHFEASKDAWAQASAVWRDALCHVLRVGAAVVQKAGLRNWTVWPGGSCAQGRPASEARFTCAPRTLEQG
jgi:hypothetical protein